MNHKKFASASMAAVVFCSVSNTSIAIPIPGAIKKPAAVIGSLLLGAGIFRLYQKTSVKNPTSRFDKEALTKALHDRNLKEIATQLGYFLDDRVVGQLYRRTAIRVDTDGKSLLVDQGCPPAGLLGTAQANVYPLTTAIGFMLAFEKFLKAASKGIEAWEYYTGYSSEA